MGRHPQLPGDHVIPVMVLDIFLPPGHRELVLLLQVQPPHLASRPFVPPNHHHHHFMAPSTRNALAVPQPPHPGRSVSASSTTREGDATNKPVNSCIAASSVLDPMPPSHAPESLDETPVHPLPVSIVTPINIEILQFCLSGHPDSAFVQFLLHGFTHGFDIG